MQEKVVSPSPWLFSSLLFCSGFTTGAQHLAVLIFISLDWAARSVLTCTWHPLKTYVLSEMNGRVLGAYNQDWWTRFIWTLSAHTEPLFSFFSLPVSLAVLLKLKWGYERMQPAPHDVTVGCFYLAAGGKPFNVFRVSALIRYRLQISAVFVL